MDETTPREIGPYAIIRQLGDETRNRTYLGKHPVSNKGYVTIRVYDLPLETDELRDAFLSRAKTLKKLKHRQIAEIIDFGLLPGGDQEPQQPVHGYLVMQYAQGKSMREQLESGQRLKSDEVKRILSPVADSLQYAHSLRIAHGNLHPGNILVEEGGMILLAGFAPLPPQYLPESAIEPAALPYMAPEQLAGKPDQASDQYALAVMVYEWLCGRRPYSATDRETLLRQQRDEQMPAPGSINGDISPAIEQVLLKALSPQPQNRFPHTHTFAHEYLRALMGFTTPLQPVGKPPEQPAQSAVPSPRMQTRQQEHTQKPAPTPSEISRMGEPAPLPPSEESNAKASSPGRRDAGKEDAMNRVPTNEKNARKDGDDTKDDYPHSWHARRSLEKHTSKEASEQLAKVVAEDLSEGGVLSRSLGGYEERPAQLEMAVEVARALSKGQHALVEASTGTGKALDVDTPIPTPTGWKRMGDLVAGDYVFNEKGHPTRVTVAFDVMYDHKCYEVLFSDGSSLIADAEHEWASYTATDRKWTGELKTKVYAAKNFVTRDQLTSLEQLIALSSHNDVLSVREAVALIGGHHWSVYQCSRQLVPVNANQQPARYPHMALLTAVKARLAKDLVEQRRDARAYTLITTEQMAATLTVSSTPRAKHAIAIADPLKLPEVNLPIAPYFLGVWLGDGSSYSNHITTADPDLIPEIEKDGYSVRSLKSHPYLYAVDDEHGKAVSRWQPGMTGRLRSLGLLRNKHIPAIYLRSSEQQRRALLAGLLDTDGTVSHTGAVELTTTSPQLAQDSYELACSLGFRPTLRCGRARLKGKDCGPKWTLAFTTKEQVFRLPRKANAQQERLRNYSLERNRFRYVVAVNEVPTRPVRCIQVDAQSHLYLAGRSMIPTHNSLAYLLPIIRAGEGAIISTANKALQEQLFFKDIPFIQKHVKQFDAALVKGVGNYICLDRLHTERQESMESLMPGNVLSRLWDITQEFELTISGDFETIGVNVPPELRSRINMDRDECVWARCEFFEQCYIRSMKEQAENAQIIVVNHTLLLLDANAGGFILPQRQVTVVDEAHHLEEEATSAFTISINQSQVRALLSLARLRANCAPHIQDEANSQVHLAWEELERVAHPGMKGRVKLRQPIEEALKLATALDKVKKSLEEQRPQKREGTRGEKEELLYDRLIERVGTLASNMRHVFSVKQPEKYVYYVEIMTQHSRQRNSPLQVSAAPLDVSQLLAKNLFLPSHVIATSATLTTVDTNPADREASGPTFAYFRKGAGLDRELFPDVQERILPLAFDYEHNSLLYLPRHLPVPAYGDSDASIGYMKAIADEMMRLVVASRGRAFLLFSSKRMMDDVLREFGHLPTGANLRLLRQGDMSRIELVKTFRASEGAVLFGLKSFWEGVDIAGEALSLVVIDKMPFDPPDDPVHEARVQMMKERGEDWFNTYVLPQAVLRLKQGLGRLLRTHEDRGVMVILDARLHRKGYGRRVLDALPPARRTHDFGDVKRFFEEEDAPF